MKRCYHKWTNLPVNNEYGYGWCELCGTVDSYGRKVLGTKIPAYYQELWPILDIEVDLLNTRGETAFINEYRVRTGMGIPEAKKAIEQYRSRVQHVKEVTEKTG